MDKQDNSLEKKAQDLAWEITKRPWIYVKIVRVINTLAKALGWIFSKRG